MTGLPSRALLALTLAACSGGGGAGAAEPASPAPAADDGPARNFDVQRLAEGVYAVVRRDGPGLMVDANNLLIVNRDDVVVVDSNGAPAITREVIAALRRLTDKPVSAVVNTHWHDDHIRGNQAYRDAFPAVKFIGHARMRPYMAAQGDENRRRFLADAPKFLGHLRGLVERGESLRGGPLGPEERAAYQRDIRLASFVLEDGAAAPAVLPDVTVADRLVLRRGDRVIEVLHLGSGHTAGDLVVHLPAERVVATGDLVVAPVPLVGDPQSHVGAWIGALERLRGLGATTLVPGHGPVQRDDRHVRLLVELMTAIRDRTAEAAARGETLEQARRSVRLDDLRRRLAGDSPFLGLLFDSYVAGPGVGVAYREASAAPR